MEGTMVATSRVPIVAARNNAMQLWIVTKHNEDTLGGEIDTVLGAFTTLNRAVDAVATEQFTIDKASGEPTTVVGVDKLQGTGDERWIQCFASDPTLCYTVRRVVLNTPLHMGR